MQERAQTTTPSHLCRRVTILLTEAAGDDEWPATMGRLEDAGLQNGVLQANLGTVTGLAPEDGQAALRSVPGVLALEWEGTMSAFQSNLEVCH